MDISAVGVILSFIGMALFMMLGLFGGYFEQYEIVRGCHGLSIMWACVLMLCVIGLGIGSMIKDYESKRPTVGHPNRKYNFRFTIGGRGSIRIKFVFRHSHEHLFYVNDLWIEFRTNKRVKDIQLLWWRVDQRDYAIEKPIYFKISGYRFK